MSRPRLSSSSLPGTCATALLLPSLRPPTRRLVPCGRLSIRHPRRTLVSSAATRPVEGLPDRTPKNFKHNLGTEPRTIVSKYEELLAASRLEPDQNQRDLVARLDRLKNEINEYYKDSKLSAPKGLYIYGPVGTGKTLATELLASSLPADSVARWHFHEFMLAVHRRLFLFRQHEKIRGPSGGDPVDLVAKSFLQPHQHHFGAQVPDHVQPGFLLLLDEFQITDPADALLLLRILRSLAANETVIVATSNRHPSALYEHGLNRKQVLKGLEEVEWDIFEVKGRDWRAHGAEKREMELKADASRTTASTSDGRGTESIPPTFGQIHTSLESLLDSFSALEPQQHGPVDIPIEIHGRTFPIPQHITAKGLRAAVISWKEIIGGFRGASDYAALCSFLGKDSKEHPPLLILRGAPYPIVVPDEPSGLDLVRRFVVLLDVAYELGVRVVLVSDGKGAAAVPKSELDAVKGLFALQSDGKGISTGLEIAVKGEGGASSGHLTTFFGDNIEWSATGLADASLAKGGAGEKDVRFAIGRARSRMMEMGGWSWGWTRVGKS